MTDYKIPYIRIPRSLREDTSWIDSSAKDRELFNTILSLVVWKERKFNDFGVNIEIKPAEICISMRDLMKECGSDYSKNDVERGLKRLEKNLQILRQEVRHVRMVITITHKDTYDLIIQAGETENETRLRQVRDSFETQKKKDNNDLSEDKSTTTTNDVVVDFPFIEVISFRCRGRTKEIPKSDFIKEMREKGDFSDAELEHAIKQLRASEKSVTSYINWSISVIASFKEEKNLKDSSQASKVVKISDNKEFITTLWDKCKKGKEDRLEILKEKAIFSCGSYITETFEYNKPGFQNVAESYFRKRNLI